VGRVEVATVIAAPPAVVWAAIEDVASHVRWMDDAVAIRFTSPVHRDVGATFDCDTAIGPLHLTDRMEITRWVPGEAMGVRHVGLVTGSGEFTLVPVHPGATRFAWSETLRFPWWLGGAIGSALGAPILRRVWRKNLANLKRIVEGSEP